MKSVKYGVTGPRGILAADMRLIESVLDNLNDVQEFTTGGAYGIDTHAALYALAKWPLSVHHRLCLPQGEAFNKSLLEYEAFEQIWVEGKSNRSSLLCRNDIIIQHSDVLLAFPKSMKEEFRGSGTWAAIRSAKKAGIEIRYFPLNEVRRDIG